MMESINAEGSESIIPSTRLKKPLIEIKGLIKTFADKGKRAIGVNALNNVSLEIGAGEFVIIKGASGSGKTTLLNIIATIDTPTAGVYLWKGMNVFAQPEKKNKREESKREKQREQIRTDIGYVFQNKNLLQYFDAVENVNIGIFAKKDLKEADATIIAKKELDKVGLSDRYDHNPTELSGGERQRVAIVRAMAKEPDLLLLDEPTGELDTKSGIMVLDLIDKLNKDNGVTIILVTHNDQIAKLYGKRLITMLDGRISEDLRRE